MAEDKNIVQNYQAHDLKIILNNNEIAPSGYNLLDFEMNCRYRDGNKRRIYQSMEYIY